MKVKNIFLSALLLGSLLTSCTGNFLDEDRNPNALSPSIFWKNEADILKGLTSVYGALQGTGGWATSYERYIVVDNYRSDEVVFRPDVSSWDHIASFVNDPNNSTTETEWTQLYRGINMANQCLDNIPNVPGETDAIAKLKKSAMAEARFLRAYYYYRLYLNYGEKVPIYLKQLEGKNDEFYPKQAESGELVTLIEKELTEVQKDLPTEYDAAGKGRATTYAAAAILGKFYMFRHEQAKGEKEFEKLIGKFELVDDYEDNFDGLHKNNSESVFEIQYCGDRTGGRKEYNNIAEHLISGNVGGYEEAFPSDWLFDLLKKDLTVDGEYSVRLYGTILFDDPNTKMWYIGEGEHFSDYDGPNKLLWKKFATWHESLSSDWWASAFNIPIVRYADVLLLYAECLNDKGATSAAIDRINEVRRRAHVPELEKNLTKEQVLAHLQNVERPCELAFEGSRWYDLVRWGKVEQTLKANGKRFAENYVDSKHKLFPIPHSEFLMNSSWEQNPNFSK